MTIKIPAQLKDVADQVSAGKQRSETVRVFLSWFGAERRGYWKVREIRKALTKVKLRTEPDFEEAWIDKAISFVPRSQPGSKPAKSGTSDIAEQQLNPEAVPVMKRSIGGLTSRIKIGMLAAANQPPLCVSPDSKVSEAITFMLQHDFSQLPVTTTERDVKGIISWKSLGSRLALGKQCTKVRECMEDPSEIRSDASLFEAIQQIVAHEFVLVRDSTRKLTGIVTTADLSVQFAQLGEPFLLLGEIENHVRNLIVDKFTKDEFATCRDPADTSREIDDVTDLTLGEYVRLLENPKRWDQLGIGIDRKTFTDELKRIGRIRNDVMHFDPDGIGSDDLAAVRKFAHFLSELERKLD